MKKLVALLCCMMLVGCSNANQERYDKLVQENTELKNQLEFITNNLNEYREELEELRKENETYDVKVSGGEVYTVVDKLVDEEIDSMEGSYKPLVVRLFQAELEIIYVPEKIANQVKIGKTYYFEIEPYQLENTTISGAYEDFYDKHNKHVISVRTPNEDEYGLADTLIVERVK